MKNEPLHKERILTMKLEGPAARDGRVTLSALVDRLDAVQKTMFNLGLDATADASGRTVGARGRWARGVRTACELRLVSVEPGSLIITTEVPEAEEGAGLPRSLGGLDVGKRALNLFTSLVVAVSSGDLNSLPRHISDPVARGRALKSLQVLCPNEDEDLTVSFSNGTSDSLGVLTSQSRQLIQDHFEFAVDDDAGDATTIIGTLVAIRVKAGNRHIVVLMNKREIRCYFSPELEETISQLVAGSIIEVRGKPSLTSSDAILNISEIFDVTTINLSPFQLGHFEWESRRFVLTKPVLCVPDFQDGLWLYEISRYKLLGYSHSRREALEALHEQLAVVYDGLVSEPDEKLTLDAIELRDLLKAEIQVGS